MDTYKSRTICACLFLIAGCTARNTQTDYYGGSPQNLSPIPQQQSDFPPSSSAPVFEAPGTSNSDGPQLLSPEPDPGPEARRRKLPVRNVRTDPWGRPERPGPSIKNTIRQKVEHRTLWESHYQSTQRRPIQTVQIGIGRSRVMVLAGLNGQDASSISVIEQFAQTMSNQATLQNACTALFVRNPNPDGVALGSPYNGRGIDLRRNFPSDNWRTTADGKAGPNAASEIETRVLIRMIDDFKPDRIIVIQNTNAKGSIDYAGPARQLARKVAVQNGYQVSNRQAAISGSLEQFAGNDRKLPVIVVSIDRRLDGKTAWSTHTDGLVMALTAADPRLQSPHYNESTEDLDPQGPVAKSKTFPLPLNINGGGATNVPNPNRLQAPRPARRGYHELPPPRQYP